MFQYRVISLWKRLLFFVFFQISMTSSISRPFNFFDKLANYRLAALLKKRLWYRCFHVNFTKFLWSVFLQNKNCCFCNKTSTETSFKNDSPWVPWFEHRENGFAFFCSIKSLFVFLLFISHFLWHFNFC